MKKGAARARIQKAGRERNTDWTEHAIDEAMNDRFNMTDVWHAMANVRTLIEQHGGTYAVAAELTWKCTGPAAGTPRNVTVVVDVETEPVTVITVFEDRRRKR